MTDFNVLTINARCFPGTEPLVVKQGEWVRIRLGNLSAMDHHPIHLHGYHFKVTETDGGRIPEAGQWPESTVLVPVGSTRTIEFQANRPGDWALHCHMTHHVMNQMVPHIVSGHMPVPANSIPMVGAQGPHDSITMGGMFTILKARETLLFMRSEDLGCIEDYTRDIEHRGHLGSTRSSRGDDFSRAALHA